MPLCRKKPTLAVAASLASLLLAPAVPGVYADLPGTIAHVVQPGETLWQIAHSAGVDVDSVARLNDLADANLIVVGQVLNLPATSTAGSASSATAGRSAGGTYTVAPGDTLWSIALRFDTTAAALVQANSLDDPNLLSIGTELSVPSSDDTVASPAAAPAPASPQPSGRGVLTSYTVQPGDTLNRIARRLDIRPDTIAQASGLDDPNRLSVGMVLRLPVPGREHVVKPGEMLKDIAADEKVDLGSLIDFNDIDNPELIHPGQVLVVPTSASAQRAASAREPARPTAPAVPAPAPAQSERPATPPAQAAAAAPKPAAKPASPAAAAAPRPGAPTEGMATLGLKFLGTRYVWGGSSPAGFDCSGFVWYLARQMGKPIPRGMLGEYNSGPHPSRDDLKPGDIVFFQNTYTPGLSHNGIYIGNGQFVHAADERSGVTISSLSAAYWQSHWFGATRLP